MADTETTQETVPDATTAMKDGQAEENNNSEEMPPSVEKTADGEPTPAESGEAEKPEDSQPEQVPAQEETDAPQEAVQTDQPSDPADNEPKTEAEPTDNNSEELDQRKDAADGQTDNAAASEDAAKDEVKVPEDVPQEMAVDSQEAPASSAVEDEKPKDEVASPETDEVPADEAPEKPTPEKVPDETVVVEEPTPERAADEVDGDATESEKQVEQLQDQSNSNENANDVRVPADVSSTVEDAAPVDGQAPGDDANMDDSKQEVEPEPQEPPQETTTEEAQVTTTAEEGENAGENVQELSTFEEKYSAAQRDIQELRALNVGIQQRLEKSEAESRERKHQSSVGHKEGMKVQADYLARELSQQQDTEKYLREKLAETLEEKEESERKCKDLQLRLKRFAKDDQAKDARMKTLEDELREVSQDVQRLEEQVDEETLKRIKESKGTSATNGQTTTSRTQKKQETPVPQSKTCTIL